MSDSLEASQPVSEKAAPHSASAPLPAQTADSPAAPAPPRFDSLRAGRIAVVATLAYIAFDLILPLVHLPAHRIGLAEALGILLVPTAIFMLLQLWLAHALVGLRWTVGHTALAAAAGIALWFAVMLLVRPAHPITIQHLELFRMFKTTALTLLLSVSLSFLGMLLSRIVREPNVLLPVALVAMPIDYVGAMTSVGFTHAAVQHAPAVVRAVSIHVPTVRGLNILPMIGPGDALFIAFFFCAVSTLDLNDRGTFWWMYGLLTATMFIVLLTPFAIAALVPMGLAVIIANVRYFRFKRAEVFAMAYAAIAIFAVVGAFYLAAHRFMFGGK